MPKFRVNSLSIIYHRAIHNPPALSNRIVLVCLAALALSVYPNTNHNSLYVIYVPSQPARNLLGEGDILFMNGISLWSSSRLALWDVLVIKVNLAYPIH